MKRLVTLICALLVSVGPTQAENYVEVGIDGGYDTLWAGYDHAFSLSIENDATLEGIGLYFLIYSDDGATWEFTDVGGFVALPDSGTFVTGVSGSRWMTGEASDGSCWDLGGTMVNDMYLPDIVMIGGAAYQAGLAPGSLQHMLNIHFTPMTPEGEITTLCIDSTHAPGLADPFIFNPGGTPASNFPQCWPVKIGSFVCPVWDAGLPTSMELIHCETGQVTLSATDFEGYDVKYSIAQVTGEGAATVGSYSGVVTYAPSPLDVGQSVQILVEATRDYYPKGSCLGTLWVLDISVTNDPPTIDCGRLYNNVAVIGDVVGKGDIVALDGDDCDDITYFLESVYPSPNGAYSLDDATGEFMFWADGGDQGMSYEFCVGAADDYDTTVCCFTVVTDLGNHPGDVDYSGEVNVSDAVSLVRYIFQGGGQPANMNWGDVNADCVVNVSDAVYLIEYVFQGGPEPLLGCVYQ